MHNPLLTIIALTLAAIALALFFWGLVLVVFS